MTDEYKGQKLIKFKDCFFNLNLAYLNRDLTEKVTGIIGRWYDSGELKSISVYKDAVPDGLYKLWNENEKHGLERTWDEYGKLKSEKNWDFDSLMSSTDF